MCTAIGVKLHSSYPNLFYESRVVVKSEKNREMKNLVSKIWGRMMEVRN